MKKETATIALDALQRLVHDINDLANNSTGVHGLHKNDALAKWEELLEGGCGQPWLGLALAEAAQAIAALEADIAQPVEAGLMERAAWILDCYAAHIKTVGADNLDAHPYLPDVEEIAESLRSAAPQEAAAPAGWKLVPIEPTPEMIKAGGHSNSEWLNNSAPIGEVLYAQPVPSVYAAMLAATPKAAP